MSYSEELCNQALEWAQLPVTNTELAILLEVSEAEIRVAMDDSIDPLGRAIRKGRMLARAEFLESVRTLAIQGSGPAQNLYNQLLRSAE